MNDQQKDHLATVPISAVRIVERAYGKTGGRMNAIKAMCLHCTGYTRPEVKHCTATICPLHAWRPYQPKADDSDDDDFFDLPDDDELESPEIDDEDDEL